MKTLITAVILTTSLALSGNVAMAAAAQAHETAAAKQVTRNVATVRHPAPAPRVGALPNIFAALFGVPSFYVAPARAGGKAAVRDTGNDYDDYTPPPDTSASDAVGWAAVQTAQDAAAQAMAQEDQSLQDMAASNAAAAAQNAAAEDMTNQYMMNEVNDR